MGLHGERLDDFPWDTLQPVRNLAARYPAGEVDLTIGSPVDPVPGIARDALLQAANSHAYPPTIGSRELRESIRAWIRQQRGCMAPIDILPTLGEKEIVAMLPSLLGMGDGDVVAFPEVAYPTYSVGARLAGATPLAIDIESDPQLWPEGISLVWLNSPSNPTGHVLSIEQMRAIVRWARESGVIVASDECYAALGWGGLERGDQAMTPSILRDDVCDGDSTGLLMLYSLSKQSNLAGYRAAFIAGDPDLVAPIRELRKHIGMMMPGPVQHAMAQVIADDEHVQIQREIYARRREMLLAALPAAGLDNDPANVAGLYLWVRRAAYGGAAGEGFGAAHASVTAGAAGESPAWELVRALAGIGIIAAPGTFYGVNAECATHVRISLTASDSDIRTAADRLAHLPRA